VWLVGDIGVWEGSQRHWPSAQVIRTAIGGVFIGGRR